MRVRVKDFKLGFWHAKRKLVDDFSSLNFIFWCSFNLKVYDSVFVWCVEFRRFE